jgi:hypothetical protein
LETSRLLKKTFNNLKIIKIHGKILQLELTNLE